MNFLSTIMFLLYYSAALAASEVNKLVIKNLLQQQAQEKSHQQQMASLQTVLDEQKKLITEKEGEISDMKLKLQEQVQLVRAVGMFVRPKMNS